VAKVLELARSQPALELRWIGHSLKDLNELSPSSTAEPSPITVLLPKEIWLDPARLLTSDLLVNQVSADSPAQKLGLQWGDRILEIGGEPVESFAQFRSRVQSLAASGTPIALRWQRGSEVLEGSVEPKQVEQKDPLTEVKQQQFQVGIQFAAVAVPPTLVVLKAKNPWDMMVLSWTKTVDLSTAMLGSFYHLAVGDISPKTLGGPVLIGKIAGESLKQGWDSFLKMMAFISLNLFILNLLPIPVLDGGHLVLFAVEAIRKKPLSLKAIEVWSTAGFVVLMSLVAVVFFNDLSRLGLFGFLSRS
jgi:regulator of sigma E protease